MEPEERINQLELALKDAIEFAEEGWSYASPYFIEKWGAKEEHERLSEILNEKSNFTS